MNVNISEKVVNLRATRNSYEEVHEPIGAYIKRERVSQGLNQDYVCKGICSVSYYSRIENNETLPGNDYIEKIFKRLNKPVPSEFSSKAKNRELIDRFLSAIEFKNEKLLTESYDEIKNTEQKHELYDMVYCIIKGKMDEAEQLIKLLHDQQRYFDDEELLIYLEMLGSFYTNKLDMDKAEKYLSLALKLQSSMNLEKPLIYYKYAWVLGKNHNDTKCIDYATKASDLFKSANNAYRTIQSQMLIAIKLSNKYFEKSANLYETLIKSSLHHDYVDLYKSCSLNYSLLLKEYKYYEKSISVFNQLINKFNDDEKLIIDIYIELIDLLIQINKFENAKYYLNQFKCVKLQSSKSNIFIKYFEVNIDEADVMSKLKLYKSEFIPYSMKINNFNLEKRFRKEYSNILEENKMYVECIEENKKIINLLEKEKNMIYGGLKMKTLRKLFIVVCLLGLFMGGLKAVTTQVELDALEGEIYPEPLRP